MEASGVLMVSLVQKKKEKKKWNFLIGTPILARPVMSLVGHISTDWCRKVRGIITVSILQRKILEGEPDSLI